MLLVCCKRTSFFSLLFLNAIICFLNCQTVWAGKGEFSALDAAIYKGDKVEVLKLLKSGQDVNAKRTDGVGTLLHEVAYQGNLEIAKILLDYDVDLTAKDKYDRTPLHLAIQGSQKEMSALLLSRGADINAKAEGGKTPLHYCAYLDKKNKEIAKVLIKNGADVMARDKDGATPLHFAARENNQALAKLLIAEGAEVDALNKYSDTPLSYVVKYKAGLSMAKLIVAHGANVNAQRGVIGWGESILHIAVQKKNLEMIKFLVDSGARINVRDDDGRLPIHRAVFDKNDDILEFLKKHGAIVPIKNFDLKSVSGLVSSKHLEVKQVIPFDNEVISIAVSSDGSQFAVPQTGKAIIFGFPSLQRTQVSVEGGPFNAVSFSRNGQFLALGDYHGMVRVLDLKKEKQISSFKIKGGKIYSVQFSPSGKGLLVGSSYDGSEFKSDMEDLANKAERDDLSLKQVGWRWFVLYVWNLLKLAFFHGDELLSLWDWKSGNEIRNFSAVGLGIVEKVDFSPDGNFFADGDRSGVRLWETKTGDLIKFWEIESLRSMKMSPNGKWLAYGNRTLTGILDLETQNHVHKFRVVSNFLEVMAGGKQLLELTRKGEIRLRDTSTGKLILTEYIDSLVGHPFNALTVHPDGQTFLAGLALRNSSKPTGSLILFKVLPPVESPIH